MKYEVEKREAAVKLFESGRGSESVARTLGVPRMTAKHWLYTYRALGKEGLLATGHRKYSHRLKVAAARDVVELGMAKSEVMSKYEIASLSPLNKWCLAYREGGPDALLPRPKGRPRKPEHPLN